MTYDPDDYPLREHTMTGRTISLGKTVKIKDGKIIRATRAIAGQSRRVKEARAAKEAAKWSEKSKK